MLAPEVFITCAVTGSADSVRKNSNVPVTPAQIAASMAQFETWDAINTGDPEGRTAVNQQLAREAGKHLVFVRYWTQHTVNEWVHNAADIDASRGVWARDLGPAEDEKLMKYYPDRVAWLLEADARPQRLRRMR